MREIQKVSFIFLMLLTPFLGYTQNKSLSFGIEGGLNLSYTSLDVHPLNKKARMGFQGGVTVEYALNKDFYLQSGLSFTTKGGKADGNINIAGIVGFNGKMDISQIYLQLPIMAAYKLQISPNTKLVFNAGPYMAYGIGGETNVKGDIQLLGVTSSGYEYKTFNDDILKRFDMGIGAGIGAEFGSVLVRFKYELGLINIGNDLKELELIINNIDYKNRNASLTVGYMF